MQDLLIKILSLTSFCFPFAHSNTQEVFDQEASGNLIELLPSFEISPLSVFMDKKGVKNWALWSDVFEKQKTQCIVGFNDFNWLLKYGDLTETQKAVLMEHALHLPEYREYIMDHDLFKLWDEETIKIVNNFPNFFWTKREPCYLMQISHLLANRLHLFLEKKEKSLGANKDSWIRHANSIFLLMGSFNAIEQKAVMETSWKAAKKAARVAKSRCSWEEACDIYWELAEDTAEKTAHSAAWFTAVKAAEDANRELVEINILYEAQKEIEAGINGIVDPAKQALTQFAMEIVLKNAKYPEEIGKASYRNLEKIWFLHLLKNFDDVAEEAYEESMKHISLSDLNNVFESRHRWNEFKSRYFQKLPNQAKHFLEPWLYELDFIVRTIEAFDN